MKKKFKKELTLLIVSCFISMFGFSQKLESEYLSDFNGTIRQVDAYRFCALALPKSKLSVEYRDEVLFYKRISPRELKNENAFTIRRLGEEYFKKRDFKKALLYYKESLAIYRELGNKNEIVKSLNFLGMVLYYLGDYSKASKFLEESVVINDQIKNKQEKAFSFNYLGLILKEQGKIKEALEYFKKVVKISEKESDKLMYSQALNNISLIYNSQGYAEKSIEFLKRSLKIKQELNDKLGMSIVFHNLGCVQYKASNYSKSLYYHKQCLIASKEIENNTGIVYSLLKIGKVYIELENYNKAIEYLDRCLELTDNQHEKSLKAKLLGLYGKLYNEKKNYNKAIKYAQASLKIGKEIGEIYLIKQSADILYKAYKNKGEYKKSLKMFELSLSMRDSTLNDSLKKELIEQELKHEYDRKKLIDSVQFNREKEIASIKYQEKIREEETKRSLLIISIIFLFAMSSVLYKAYVVKKRTNKRLEETSLKLQRLNDKLKFFSKVIAHDFRDPVLSFKMLVQKIGARYKDVIEPKDLRLLQFANNSMKNLDCLANDLLLFHSIENREVDLKKTPLDMEILVNKIKTELEIRFQTKVDLKTKDLPTLVLNKNLIYQLFTNLVSNSIRYSRPGIPLKIAISAERKSSYIYQFCVTDNGQGIPDESKIAVFDIFNNGKKIGPSGFGIGLPICKNIIDYYNGDVWVKDTDGNGTTICFSIDTRFL